MAFRTLVIESRCKLEHSLNYLVCRKENEVTRVVIDEIKTLVINSLQVSITTGLISELMKKKIKIIFIDEHHNPLGETVPYQNNYYSYRKIKDQIGFPEYRKNYLWKKIVIAKIINQAKNLNSLCKNKEYNMLLKYASEVVDGDANNREGHSAKVYFHALFGKDFSRDDEIDINKYLNYGYSIILSSINREIKTLGYLTELGIHHIGESNSFNLSCDFMEPLRPLIDKIVINSNLNNENFKNVLINSLTIKVKYNEKEMFLDNAIHLMVEDLLGYLSTGEENKIKFLEYEL